MPKYASMIRSQIRDAYAYLSFYIASAVFIYVFSVLPGASWGIGLILLLDVAVPVIHVASTMDSFRQIFRR